MPRLLVSAALLWSAAAHALRFTRRQCCHLGAAAVALAPSTALANDALEDAFSARTKVLRPLPAGTCDAPTPEWLRGDWTVAASRFEGVSFPQSGSYYPRGGFTQTIAGARRGTILAIPNAGAAPKGYARSYASTLATSSDVTNAASTLKAFWSDATDIAVEQSAKRTVIRYAAPTVKRGVLPQRIVADRLACASESPSPSSLIVAERWAQASVVDDADAALTSLSGTYTAWHRYDRVDQGVRETLRVAAFDDNPAADDIRPAAVYDYSFFLRRRVER
jgi:hypothetical protein